MDQVRHPLRKIAPSCRSQRRTALATIVSKTGCTSVGELADDAQNLAGGRLLLERLVSSRFRVSSSLNRRTFSMAITAWSANVWSRSMCFSENGHGPPANRRSHRSDLPRAASATARTVRTRRTRTAASGVTASAKSVSTPPQNIADVNDRVAPWRAATTHAPGHRHSAPKSRPSTVKVLGATRRSPSPSEAETPRS